VDALDQRITLRYRITEMSTADTADHAIVDEKALRITEPPPTEPHPRYHDQDRITTTTTSSPTPNTAPLNPISWPPSTHPDPRQPR
jgi:hypothetical protein